MYIGVLDLRLESGPLPVVVFAVSAALIVVLATRRPMRRWLPIQLLAALVGALVAFVGTWLISDVWDVFGLPLTFVVRGWFVAAIAAVAFCIAGSMRTRTWRKVVAVCAVVSSVLAGAIGINLDVAEFPTLGDALGSSRIATLNPPKVTPTLISETQSIENWSAPADMRGAGNVGAVTIPATVSHFAARQAIVYLPPAALVPAPPKLPVLEMFSGQPGSPSDIITSGELAKIADGYAAHHRGLAPIVVIPDQLGAPEQNPMCVDSPLGNSATYLTTDVPNWILSHLNVLTDRASWAIGGFSQGGTCAIQLGTKFTARYGSILDISGELVPHRGSVSATIQSAFGNSSSAYSAAAPVALLAAGAPFADTLGIFIVGQADTKFGPPSATISRAASVAGMTVDYRVSPGTAHDWRTVRFALTAALPLLGARWGLQ